MALHIQMTDSAVAQLRRTAFRNKLSSTLAGVLLILLGGIILYFTVVLIAGPAEPEFLTYVPPAEEQAPPSDMPVTADLTSKPASPAQEVAPSVIVAVGAAPVQMAQVEVPVADVSDGVGMELGVGMGVGGLGEGLGVGGTGLGDGKGGGGSALEGTFYDFKQTRQGSPTGIGVGQGGTMKCMEIINDFMKSWNPAVLAKYYQSPTKLYISSFYTPQVMSEYAPLAFQCADRVQPANWCAVYRGKVKAPKSGTFRFMAVCDETMLIRFDGKLVLEAGYRIPSGAPEGKIQASEVTAEGRAYKQAIRDGKQKRHPGYEFAPYPSIPTYNREVGGLTCGTEFKVEEGKAYPIEILVGDFGGAFGFFLCIQDVTDGKAFPAKPDLFRTNFAEPSREELQKVIPARYIKSSSEYLDYNRDSPIWVAVP